MDSVRPDWDQYFLDIARATSSRSQDPSMQVGVVIVGPDRDIRATGYNGLPRGVPYSENLYTLRPTKYFWIEHAERNAIYAAARRGSALDGCTIYQQTMPCADCARAIVQVGIKKIVTENGHAISASGFYDKHPSVEILKLGGVHVREHPSGYSPTEEWRPNPPLEEYT